MLGSKLLRNLMLQHYHIFRLKSKLMMLAYGPMLLPILNQEKHMGLVGGAMKSSKVSQKMPLLTLHVFLSRPCIMG